MNGTVDYRLAKAIACRADGRVDACNEYERAFHFFRRDYDGEGYDGVVVLKDTGKVISWMTFLTECHPKPTFKALIEPVEETLKDRLGDFSVSSEGQMLDVLSPNGRK